MSKPIKKIKNFFKPKLPPPPAAAPAVAAPEAPVQELGGQDEVNQNQRRKRGRSSLRIDPQTGGVPSGGGSGVNVPMK